MKKIFSLAFVVILALSFTAFASDFVFVSSSVENGASSVDIYEGTITLEFSEDVSVAEITMKKDYSDFSDFTKSIDNNKVNITFNSAMDYSTQYTIKFNNCKNDLDEKVSGDVVSIIFTTEDKPIVSVENVILTKGIGNTISITDPESFAYDDYELQGFNLSIKNSATEITNVNIVCALYNSTGIIQKVISTEKEIDASAVEAIELGTLIDSTFSGGKAKIYIWNNFDDQTPLVKSIEYSIQ